ncbi:hypothetical protein LK533_10255 [Sphingomonas sp. PL-96]|nr:hypothetical protein [Sphingomonas sp. PL-96]
MTAKLIFVLIAVASIFVIWAILRSFNAVPTTTPRGSQALPEQAAYEAQTNTQ